MAAVGGRQASESEVSRICQEPDKELPEALARPVGTARSPCAWFDATYERVRMAATDISPAGVRECRERWVPGVDMAPSEGQQFWLELCSSLLTLGLQGVDVWWRSSASPPRCHHSLQPSSGSGRTTGTTASAASPGPPWPSSQPNATNSSPLPSQPSRLHNEQPPLPRQNCHHVTGLHRRTSSLWRPNGAVRL